MYVPKDYELAEVSFPIINEKWAKLEANRRRAVEIFKSFINSEYDEVYPQNLILITVEGYKCIGYIIDEFEPKEMLRVVQPFDEEKIYPRQLCVQNIRFANYRECIECNEWPPM